MCRIGLFIALLFLGSCADHKPNLSKLSHDVNKRFLPTKLFQKSNGNIIVVGTDFDSVGVVIHKYDKRFNLIDRVNLNQELNHPKTVSVHELADNYLTVSVMRKDTGSVIELLVLDSNYHTIESNRIVERDSPNIVHYDLHEFDRMNNGDYLITADTSWKDLDINTPGQIGTRIMRLDKNLNVLWEFKGKRTIGTGRRIQLQVNAIELEDGKIFYQADEVITGNDHVSLEVRGLLSPAGALIYQKADDPRFDVLTQMGLSKAGNNVIVNIYATEGKLQYYTLIDPRSGEVLKETRLPQNIVNGSYPSRADKLPRVLNDNSGHLLQKVGNDDIFYHVVNQNGDTRELFSLPLESYDFINQYVSCQTTENTILVVVNYAKNNLAHFDLMEFNMDGSIVQ